MAFFHRTRTGSEPDPLLQHYYVEVLDRPEFLEALHWYDLAHVVALKESGLISVATAQALLRGLKEMEQEGVVEARRRLSLGGVHSGENYLQQMLGESVSGWIHIGRSSPTNRSVATRLVTRDLLLHRMEELAVLQEALLARAEEYSDTVMPLYAYLHSTEPCTFGHYLLSFVYTLQRAWETFELAYRHTNESASAAEVGAGSYFAVNLEFEAKLLGCDRVGAHAREIIRHFDYLLMSFFALALLGNVAARLGQDLRVFSTKEFGLLDLGSEFSISSSVAVQTRIPYAPGILAATGGGLLLGRLAGAMAICKTTSDEPYLGTELVRELWHSAEEMSGVLRLLTGTIRTLKANRERMRLLATQQGTQATAVIALVMQRAGVSYRSAHQVVGRVLNQLEGQGLCLLDLNALDLQAAVRELTGVTADISEHDLRQSLDVDQCVRMKVTRGGTSHREVERMLKESRDEVETCRNTIRTKRAKLAEGRRELERHISAILQEESSSSL